MSSNTKYNIEFENSENWTEVEFLQSPARLHFGLLEVCADQHRLYGGIGAMIEQPALRLSLQVMSSRAIKENRACFVDADEPWKSRIELVANRWMQSVSPDAGLPTTSQPIRLRLDNPPQTHAGLGSGTQLACATVSLLNRWYNKDLPVPLDQLARMSLRGKRSFVGLAGHQRGGFIVDRGLSPTNAARTVDRIDIPLLWYVLIAKPTSTPAISGVIENDYFGKSQSPNPHRESMWKMITDIIVPALQASDLNRFGQALYEYGRDAGRVFSRVQGGIYRDRNVTSLIDWIRAQGVLATGQTSWGPSVYAILESKSDAESLHKKLLIDFPSGVECMTTAFNHSGYYSLATST